MAFTPNNLSQQDPQWKSTKIGSSNETIGHVGCAVTSVAMLLSGHGYPETPASLNKKLKDRGGFVDAAIIWGAVSSIYPPIVTKPLILCRDTDAPLAQINAAIAAGQPVIVEVDSSPAAGLQTHWVVLYAKKSSDYLMLDPWPYPPESGKEVLLTSRYSHAKPLKRAITAVVMYECKAAGGGAPPPVLGETGLFVQVLISAEAGLRLRAQPTLNADTLAIEPPAARLHVIEPENVALPKIGVYDQWIRVRDPQGLEGCVAAWFVEAASQSAAGAAEGPTPESGSAPPTTEEPAKPKKLIVVVSASVGGRGLRLRAKPKPNADPVATEPAGAKLTVLEKPEKARPKIGAENQWLNVRDPKGRRGYVMAKYVELKGE